MKLIVGLGNPGRQYENTYHNLGFLALDRFADDNGISSWSEKSNGKYTKSLMGLHVFMLLKPIKFMNLSGEVCRAFLDYFKIPVESMLVLTDDIELPLGKLRYRTKGGHGGHNGLRNIILHCGENFQRIRIGIGRADDKVQVRNHVLGSIPSEQKKILDERFGDVSQAIENHIRGNRINLT